MVPLCFEFQDRLGKEELKKILLTQKRFTHYARSAEIIIKVLLNVAYIRSENALYIIHIKENIFYEFALIITLKFSVYTRTECFIILFK